MLFAYTYVPHQLDKMQEFIDYIFFDVWCNAPIGLVFHPNLFLDKPELQDVMSEFGFSVKAAERGKLFYKEVKVVYEHFASLSANDIDQLKRCYRGNNDLEKICANDPTAQLARYADIAAKHPALSIHLASFFKELYSQSLLGLAALKSKIGSIDEHYKAFVKTNKTGKCPYCGISRLLSVYNSRREAYDHYLPKAIYPFNSINFRNLLPTCHHCNSSYKGCKDPAYTSKDAAGGIDRRKMFYPFSTDDYRIELHVLLQHGDIENLVPDDIELTFGPPELAEQIDTWKDVYGIEERYRAELCSEDAKDWLEQVLTAKRLHNETAGLKGRMLEDYLEDVACHATRSPYANENFLKHGFLQACKAVGIFDAAAKSNIT